MNFDLSSVIYATANCPIILNAVGGDDYYVRVNSPDFLREHSLKNRHKAVLITPKEKQIAVEGTDLHNNKNNNNKNSQNTEY